MMQRFMPFLASLFLVSFIQLAQAQGTIDNGFVFSISSPNLSPRFYSESTNCGWSGAEYGTSITTDVVDKEIVWGYDAIPVAGTTRPDSFFCDTTRNNYAGKWVMVRRGDCFFLNKAINVQKSGASAVIIVNNSATPDHTDCTSFPVGLGANPTAADRALASQLKIPVILVGRAIGATIAQELRAGRKVTGSFRFPRMSEPYLPFHYATPLSQVDTVVGFGVRINNRTAETASNVVVRATIQGPGNLAPVVLQSTVSSIGANKDSLVIFTTPYVMPKVKGTYRVTYSNSKFTSVIDTLRQNFIVTDYTYASDNLVPSLGLRTAAGLEAPDYFYAACGFATTGDTKTKATHISFGITNAAEVFVPNKPEANIITCILYDGDADDDNTLDLDASFTDLGYSAVGLYTLTGTEPAAGTIDVELSNVDDKPGFDLKTNHLYYPTVNYSGRDAAVGRPASSPVPPAPAYLASAGLNYAPYGDPDFPAYLFEGTTGLFNYIGNPGAPIVRLQLEGFKPVTSVKNQPLAAEKLQMAPNPATDLLRVELALTGKNERVTMVLIDWIGRSVRTQVLSDFQAGVLNFNVADLPSGAYVLAVQTAEGMTARKLSICH
jgi:PA domain/Secretion system C-terminal sorting domain